jgi:hypothetical protein
MSDFLDSVSVAIPDLDRDSYIVENVKVEYEWKPPICDRCCVFGHWATNCPKQPVQISKPTTSMVDEEGFTKVAGKKVAKKQGLHMKSQKQKSLYRPVLIKSTENVGKGVSGSKSLGRPSSSVPNKKNMSVKTSNPFDVLANEEDRVIEPGELEAFAYKLNEDTHEVNDEDDDEVEEIYNESTTFLALGSGNHSKGESTPSANVTHV